MNSIWNNERLKQSRQNFLTDFSAKVTASCAPVSPAKQKKSATKTHVVPPSMFRFLINQQGPQAAIQMPFKQAVITNKVKRASSVEMSESRPAETSAKKTELLRLDTMDSLLSKDVIDPRIWSALTGEGSARVTHPEQTIAYVHQDALALITAHQNEFKDGLVFDNLPIGLQLKITPDGSRALCVEETPRMAVNPLTVRLDPGAQLSADDQALNDRVNTWFDEQLNTLNKDAILLSLLNHDPQQPATDKVLALLSEFALSEAQCRGLCQLLMRTGPQGVLICLQTLQRMKKDPSMFDVFNATFLQSGDYCQFMSQAGQDNLDYFTQLRGSKLTWWNALVEQHQAAGGRVDFNDLFGAYRYFLTELERMGLYNLPSSCPFKSVQQMKVVLDRALFIIQQVNPAERLLQLMSLDGLDFGPNSAYFAMRYDGFKWVSKEMCFIPEDGSTASPLSYSVSPQDYYHNIGDQAFYRYLGQHKPASVREIYDGLKEQIAKSKLNFTVVEQAQLLYLVVITQLGEEPDRDMSHFLKALTAASTSAAGDIITALFVGFKEVGSSQIPFNQLTQILTVLTELSYTAPETLLTCLPKVLSLLTLDDALLSIVLKRHEALKENEHESRRFVNLINTLNSTQFSDNAIETTQFLKVLALLPEDLTQHNVSTLSTSLNGLTLADRTRLLAMLSAINIDKSTMASFTFDKVNQILAQLTVGGASLSNDDLDALIATELPGIKIGDKDDAPSTFSIADCTKEYIQQNSPVEGLKKSPLSYLATQIEEMITGTLTQSGEELYAGLNKIEEQLKGIISSVRMITPMSLVEGMMKTEEEINLVREYFKTMSMKVYIPFIFLNRFKKALARSVQSLQTGQPVLDEFLMTAMDRVPTNESDPFGTAIKHYNEQFESVKSLTNTLLDIKNRNLADYSQCVALLNDPTTWSQIGLGNMASLLVGLGDPVSAQLKNLLSTISSISTTPTDAQLQAAIKDLSLLEQSKAELGDATYQILLEQAVKHDLTQTTSFPLAALIGFKQGNMAGIDPQQADALFKSVLRIINLSPPDEPDIVIALIDKTTRLVNQYAKDMPNIVSFLTIELDAIATTEDHKQLLEASSSAQNSDFNFDWWFLLKMFAMIMSSITFLWVMISALWNPPAPAAAAVLAETEKATETLAQALKGYNTSLDVIEQGLSRHQAAHPACKELFTFWPYPTLKRFTGFFTGEKHAAALNKWEHQKQDFSAQLSVKTQALSEVKIKLAESLVRLNSFKTLMASDPQAHPELLRAMVVLATQSVKNSEHEYNTLLAESTELEVECGRLQEGLTKSEKGYEDALQKSLDHLNTSITRFDQDPFTRRNKEHVLKHQRSIERVEDVIHDMSNLLQNESFSDADQNSLARQFMYLNTIGTEASYPLVVGDMRCENLAEASRRELQNLATALVSVLRASPGPNALDEETLTLQLMAVMREAYYRSTGIFPYSTQMLSVLVSLNHPGNVMMQINTGEGKSTTTAMLAGLQCVLGGSLNERQNKSRTQVVCTGNATLVEQGYAESHRFFNDFLGIPSSVINQVDSDQSSTNNAANRLAIGGVTYTTVQALSFYKQREKRAGRSFTEDAEGHVLGMDCTFDECDSAFLDDYTQLSLVVPIADSVSSSSNPYAWVFPLVNEFVSDSTIQNNSLRDFIENHELTTTSQRLQLLSIPDSKLEQWLDAANDIVDYREGLDFVILEEDKRVINDIERVMAIVTPLNRSGAPQRGSSFPNYRQEMLQAKMKQQAPNKYFPIDPEVDVVDQESVKSLIDGLAKQGRIVGLSGTLGSIDELKELDSAYHVQAVKIPPHQKNRRDTSTPVLLSDTSKKQDYDLRLMIDKGKDQPLLVVCKTILDVESLYRKLVKKYPGRVQKITGKESEAEITQRKDRAGVEGMITIGTPLMGRGVDFKTKYPKGFHLHQRFIDAQRETEQVMGRVARNGQLGKYSASYVIDGVPFQYGFSVFGVDKTAAMKQLKEQQKKITQDAATVRHYIQAFDAIQQVTLQQFDACKQQLLETNSDENKQLESRLSALRTSLIEKLDAAWKSGLPKGDNPNPYLNDKHALNLALKKFEKQTIPDLWKEIHSTLVGMDATHEGSRLTWYADIKQALNARQVNAKREKVESKRHAQQAHARLQSALDPAGAMLFYSKDVLSLEQTVSLKNESDKAQVGYLFKDVNAILGAHTIEFDDKKTTVENLATVINTLAKCYGKLSVDQQYQLHATIAQAIDYYNRPDYAACATMLAHPIEGLEQQATKQLRGYLATELEKRLVWAKPNKKGMDYWVERQNVRDAADELYALAATLRNGEGQDSLTHLYERLYYYQKLFKDDLTSYMPWGHEDIRVFIDDALRHISDLKRIESVDQSSFQKAQDSALFSLYFKQFNDQVNKISQDYAANQDWKEIADKIKSIQDNPSVSILHDLKHYLTQHATVQLKPTSNHLNYFFNIGSYFPVKNLLKELDVIRSKIQQTVPELLSDKTYLANKERILTQLINERGMGTVQALTITPKHSGIGEYFELRIEGAEHPEQFDEHDVVRYESNIEQLKQSRGALQLHRATEQTKMKACSELLQQLAILEPTNVHLITSDLPEHQEAIKRLNADLNAWQDVKNNTLLSSFWSYFDQYPFSPEITEQIDTLFQTLKQQRDEVRQQTDLVSKDIAFITKTINDKELIDTTVIIKQFQSMDELLSYEDKLSQRVDGPAASM